MKERARSLFSSPGIPEIKAHVVLNCIQESPGIQTLRNKIVDLVYKCNCKGHPILGSSVPQKFVRLQSLILKEVEGLGNRIPVLTINDVRKLWKMDSEESTNEGLGQAVKFLHEAGKSNSNSKRLHIAASFLSRFITFYSCCNHLLHSPGVLVHYDDPVAHLNDLFFVQPEWLCQVISSVVSVRSPNGQRTNGLIKRKELVKWIKDEKSTVQLPYNLLPQFLRYDSSYKVAW